MPHTESSPSVPTSANSFFGNKDVNWWIMLGVAVLAVPAFAIMMITLIQPSGVGVAIIFMASCWLCTYAGLRVMKNPRIAIPYMLEKMTLSEEERQQYIAAIGESERSYAAWKQEYEQCHDAFMGLARQPAWDYMDQLAAALSEVKHSLSQNGAVAPAALKNLNAWMVSSKPAAVESYLHALAGAYAYARSVMQESGRNIDTLYPGLEKGDMTRFERAPHLLKNTGRRLLIDIRNKYPFVAAQLNHMTAPDRDTPMFSVPVRKTS